MSATSLPPDVTVENDFTIFLVRGETREGKNWMLAHLPDDVQRFGGAVVVEHRYISDIIEGMRADGLIVGKAA